MAETVVSNEDGSVMATVFNADTIDAKTKEQFIACLEPSYVKQAALMADGHLGYTAPIGSVIATKGFVVPAWVGYDIGCGVYTVRTSFTPEDVYKNREDILALIKKVVPMGFKHNDEPQTLPTYESSPKSDWFMRNYSERKGMNQLCTLGGGNHFIEIGADHDTETVCISIHSGSRGIGHDTASHYMKLASNSNKAKEGNYALNVAFDSGKDYIKDMTICTEFAKSNRCKLSYRISAAMNEVCGRGHCLSGYAIDTVHNTVKWSHKRNLWVHRKGAVEMYNGTLAVLPANMRDGIFVIKGIGNNINNVDSASHGAGRAMGRKDAQRKLDMEAFKEDMKNIVCDTNEGTIAESPRAYKDIMSVIDAQSGIFQVVNHVEPLISIKAEDKPRKKKKKENKT